MIIMANEETEASSNHVVECFERTGQINWEIEGSRE